ncbi:Putative phage abortive infection protein [Paenibacillus sp. UNC496MF]|uniref:putative phage abortive infection protein n=1 Tax=Paenibacillus sp. UNC496MF TaxID=1502753 RepID=UPI0008EC7E58|nr:putative phage abortive infection protein [Paenibacillus sp. UNC496MF]SFJ43980.1 Putative phage abortive infection protein [Paenibacillus sp. UNC496MF]
MFELIIIVVLLAFYFLIRSKKIIGGILEKLAIIVVLLAVISPVISYLLYKHDTNFALVGPVGDWFGGSITPFLTLGAFIIAYSTFLSQKEELKISKQESRRQERAIRLESFEGTFFRMLTLHYEIVNSIQHIEEETHFVNYQTSQKYTVPHNGRNFFTLVINRWGILNLRSSSSELQNGYDSLYRTSEDKLGHYFRNLFHIISFIDTSADLEIYNASHKIDEEKTFEKRKSYIRIIRAQLSSNELILLFYNSRTDVGKNFYDLIVKYQLLNNLRSEVLPESVRPFFLEMKQA